MANLILTNTTNGSQTWNAGSGEFFVLTEGSYIIGTPTGLNVTGDDSSRKILLDGKIFSSVGHGIRLQSTGGDPVDTSYNNIIIGENGAVSSELTAISVRATFTWFSNEGSVVSKLGDAVHLDGGHNRMFNYGTITSVANTGVSIEGTNAYLSNHGAISGVQGISHSGGDHARIVNHGDISSAFNGIQMLGLDARVINAGAIVSVNRGVDFFGNGFSFINSGSVTSGSSTVYSTQSGQSRTPELSPETRPLLTILVTSLKLVI